MALMSDVPIDTFIARHRLPPSYSELIERELPALCAWIDALPISGRARLLGVSGAQGTGKTTLAELLQLTLSASRHWTVVVLSLDDFYLTRAERQRLAREVHPLLATRGVPGTHDVELLTTALDELRSADATRSLTVPRFDKATDDRAPQRQWQTVRGPVDLVILEGWCVGTLAQDDDALAEPVNALERQHDPDGRWRRFINRQLSQGYRELFAMLDALVYLQAPDFAAVTRWRWLQERRLAERRSGGAIMDREQLTTFLQYFERLTRHNMATLPAIADVVITLDAEHRVAASHYRASGSAKT